jgi:hypothetical protein
MKLSLAQAAEADRHRPDGDSPYDVDPVYDNNLF